MKYEGDVNYANDPYGMPPQRGGGRRGLLGLGLAVVGIVAFAGAIVVVYGKGGGGTVDGAPPLLTADATPTKMRPEQPGGMEVPHQDKLVYERLSDRGTRSNVERLLPPPEQPLPRPVVTPQMPPPPPLPQAPAVAQVPPPPPGATATVPRIPMEAEPAEPAALPPLAAPPPVAATPAPAPAPAVKAAPPPAVKPPPVQPVQTAAVPPAPPKQPAAPAAAPQPAPQAAKPAPAPAAAPQPAAPTKSPGASGWRIQLASVRSEAEAASEWKRLTSRYGDALGGLSMQVAKADLGEKGIFYRVQGVGVDETRAKAACAALKAQNVGCVVVRP
ncbi:SPOR domain-containing protein [Azospirillum soli]|uniref:SPOR domain-containing protein n=1 Tax=Azospirillum soli TaxID=1304799 RepID=UPI001AE201AE|nr:SPOR domain-containing protein [Azospirillum soli]MBP2316040.1 hypothetical protein [Azospirillum soli]